LRRFCVGLIRASVVLCALVLCTGGQGWSGAGAVQARTHRSAHGSVCFPRLLHFGQSFLCLRFLCSGLTMDGCVRVLCSRTVSAQHGQRCAWAAGSSLLHRSQSRGIRASRQLMVACFVWRLQAMAAHNVRPGAVVMIGTASGTPSQPFGPFVPPLLFVHRPSAHSQLLVLVLWPCSARGVCEAGAAAVAQRRPQIRRRCGNDPAFILGFTLIVSSPQSLTLVALIWCVCR
jgi:hypothetical protein